MSASTRILIGLGMGLIGGVSFSLLDISADSLLPSIIEPIGTLWVNGIRMTVVPLLMALMITAIAGQETTGTIAQLGGKAIALFVTMIVVSSLFTFFVAPPLIAMLNIDPDASRSLLERTTTATVGSSELPPFRDWLVALIPINPIRAAVNNAILPLMIFTGLFSMALLKIETKERAAIVSFFTAIKDTMFVLIGWIMLLAPVGIFALVFPLAATLGVSAISVLGSFIVIVSSLIVVFTLALYPLAVYIGRIPLRDFTRALAPAQIVGFSTRSSLAALPASFTATEALGISSRVSGMVLPIAVTLFHFASPMGRTAGTYFVASLYGIDLSIYELFIIAAAIGLLSFYSPAIPSGGLLIMAPVYISLGLPVEGIGILIAIDLIVDMFITAANVSANVTVAAMLSRSRS
ncbi:MAG: dicarboxylate/amino acid:cation symporter [Pseudomonadales bacterium]|jgi:Na+/H+-dicarboxylate symporter|nr:dicarboxylate/amino acid:cation symporter [Pseudomonadales bacterium]MDB3908938.1 dicarboxylate/amino acid:cation symporter [Gammaproteobacteria bacterium]